MKIRLMRFAFEIRVLAALLCLLSLSGCVDAVAVKNGKRKADEATMPAIPLLQPSTLGAEISVQQVLRAAFGNQELSLSTVLSLQGDTMNVIGVTPTGQRVFSVRLQGETVSVEAGVGSLPGPSPRQLLTDIQFSLWPLAELQRHLKGTEWRVSEPAKHTRRLFRKDRLIAEAHYANVAARAAPWNDRLWLVNFQFGYSLSVEPAPQ